ncbi:LamG-like jellyroll fold domain-containing protein [Kutzneria sp. NPDC052558]|uniref:LamG-like jellyroll fold domain-containing protein n=1 Tax=Kutzneria sp. NPDC052558 TaxID=3364121 RepID=UPI0037C818E0
MNQVCPPPHTTLGKVLFGRLIAFAGMKTADRRNRLRRVEQFGAAASARTVAACNQVRTLAFDCRLGRAGSGFERLTRGPAAGGGYVAMFGGRSTRLSVGAALATAGILVAGTVSPPSAVSAPQPHSSSPDVVGSTGKPAPTPSPGKPASPNSTPTTTSSPAKSDTRSEVSQARSSHKPVPVDSLTTETQQVTAQPDGSLKLTETTEPQRTRQQGKWVPIDTTLHQTAQGGWAPAATAYGSLLLSGGGDSPLATTTSGSTTYTVKWPSPLPAPAVTGPTATYAGVFPGVDLQVTATTTGGFTDVLVVTNSDAARNPALDQLQLPTTLAGGHITTTAGGIQIVSDDGAATLTASAPLMWDSPKPTATASPKAGSAADSDKTGVGAHVSVVKATASSSSLKLEPDRRLLNAKSTAFPVYIDPTFNWSIAPVTAPDFEETKAGSPCNGVPLFDSTDPEAGDSGALGVGYNGWKGCIGIERAYYQWRLPDVTWGSIINKATVYANKYYSADCNPQAQYTVDMHWTGGISSLTSWNSRIPDYGRISSATTGAAYNPDCNPNGARSVTAAFDATGRIRASTAAHDGQLTVSLQEDSYEPGRNKLGFSRFYKDAVLEIQYNNPPDTPNPSSMYLAAGSTTIPCATSSPYSYLGRSLPQNTPTLNVLASDRDGNPLQVFYQYWLDGATPGDPSPGADGVGSGTNAQFSLPGSFLSGLSNGQVVDWRAQVTDGEATSGWSPTCHFIAEPVAPTAPTISSADGKFLVTQAGGVAGAAPVDRWSLHDGHGAAAASTGPHGATLSGGATWAADPTRGTTLSLDNVSGYASTNTAVVNTAGSYSVSVWVRLNSTNDFYTIASQGGTNAASFYLQYNKNLNAWAFISPNNDSTNPTSFPAAQSTTPPALNTWTNLVGVFNTDDKNSMTLYVNGQQVGKANNPTPWNSTGPFAFGAAKTATGTSNYLNGSISDVQVYNYALKQSDVTSIAYIQTTFAGGGKASDSGQFTLSTPSSTATKLVYSLDKTIDTTAPQSGNVVSAFSGGASASPADRWKFTEGNGNAVADTTAAHPVTLTGGTSWGTDPVHGKVLGLDGSTGYGSATGPALNTAGSYSVSAWVKLNSTSSYYTIASQGGTNAASFYLQYNKNLNAWAFISPSNDSTNPTSFPAAQSTTPPALSTWTNLVGVFNADDHSMTLYVDGQQVGRTSNFTAWSGAGPFTIGAAKTATGTSDYLNGSVSDVQTYARALVPSEVASIHATANISVTPMAPGTHYLYAYAADAAGNVSESQSYEFLAAGNPNVSCGTFDQCLAANPSNNIAISSNSAPNLGNADGTNSISAEDLQAAGWQPGGKVTVDGATFTLPQFGTGKPDNLLAANQTITYSSPVPAHGTTSLVFLATATNAKMTAGDVQFTPNGTRSAPAVTSDMKVAGSYCFTGVDPQGTCPANGVITTTNGSSSRDTAYSLIVPDWITGPDTLAAVKLPHENTRSGQNTTNSPKIYAFAVALPASEAGRQITSVTLPDVSNQVFGQGLHIFAMATRNTTSIDTNISWTGAWASPNEGQYTQQGANFTNQTFRIALKPSLAGNTVRIKLDNSLGTNPLTITNTTIASSSTGSTRSSTTAADMKPLTFNTSRSLTIPAGGMAYSDPLTFSVSPNQYVLVSFSLSGSVPYLVEHTWSNDAWEYTTPPGTVDQSGTPSGALFTGPNGAFTNLLTGLDVTTNHVGTTVVLGDGLIDAPNTHPYLESDLAAVLSAAEPTTPAPYGTVSAGIESNEVTADYAQPSADGRVGGPSALSRVDRDLLAQPGVTTVVLYEGLQDVLNGKTADEVNKAQAQLVRYLYDANITVIAVGLTPCTNYAGRGGSSNDACSDSVEAQRQVVNQELSGGTILGLTAPSYYYLNSDLVVGKADPATNHTVLDPNASMSDHVNLFATGYAALTSKYLGPHNTWLLDDGTSRPETSATKAVDSADQTLTPWFTQDGNIGQGEGTLHGSTSWANDPTRGNTLQLDGSTGYVATAGPLLTTTGSYSVSAWANLSSTTNDSVIASQDGSQNSAFTLKYDATTQRWAFSMAAADTAGATQIKAVSQFAPATNTWTHLVGTYNATTGTLTLFVNGSVVGTAHNTTPFAAGGALAIGRGLANATNTGFFSGKLSNVQAWSYALAPAQVLALNQQIS